MQIHPGATFYSLVLPLLCASSVSAAGFIFPDWSMCHFLHGMCSALGTCSFSWDEREKEESRQSLNLYSKFLGSPIAVLLSKNSAGRSVSRCTSLSLTWSQRKDPSDHLHHVRPLFSGVKQHCEASCMTCFCPDCLLSFWVYVCFTLQRYLSTIFKILEKIEDYLHPNPIPPFKKKKYLIVISKVRLVEDQLHFIWEIWCLIVKPRAYLVSLSD